MYLNNGIYKESARVYLKQADCLQVMIKCCLCNADAFTKWPSYTKHLELHKQQNSNILNAMDDDNDEIQAEVEVELSNLRAAGEPIGVELLPTDCFEDEETIGFGLDDDDKREDMIRGSGGESKLQDIPVYNVRNTPNRPFFSLSRTNPELMHDFIALMHAHESYWHANYKGAEYVANRRESAERISQSLAQRWRVSFLPDVVNTSIRWLQRWFAEQYFSFLRFADYKCPYPIYYEKLLEFLPTSHLCVLICEICSRRFPTETLLQIHKKRSHRATISHVCRICNISFLYASKLRIHQLREHIKSNKWQCQQCNYKASCKWDYKAHFTTHSEARNYVCELCGNTYKSSTALSVHRRSHQEPTMQCSYCNRMFHQKHRLKKHIERMHECENARNFPCGICKRRFITAEVLELHKLIHATKDSE